MIVREQGRWSGQVQRRGELAVGCEEVKELTDPCWMGVHVEVKVTQVAGRTWSGEGQRGGRSLPVA